MPVANGRRKRKENDKRQDKARPKKAMTPYMYFSQETRAKIRAENPDMSFGDIGKTLGARWRTLSDAERIPYEEKSRMDRERYEREKHETSGSGSSPEKNRPNLRSSVLRGISGYKYFCDAHRDEVRALYPHLTMCEHTAILAQKWRDAPESVRKAFEMQAKADRESLNAQSKVSDLL